MLLQSERHAAAKAYRIVRAFPDGTMHLRGVDRERFAAETGMFFYGRSLQAAREDYDSLRELSVTAPLPCKAQLLLGELPEGSPYTHVVGLAYAAECDDEIAQWMLDNLVAPGEHADGGPARLAAIRQEARTIDSCPLPSAASRTARSREEVLAATGRAVQRVA